MGTGIDDLINAGKNILTEVEAFGERLITPKPKPVNYFLQSPVKKSAGLAEIVAGTIGASAFGMFAAILAIIGSVGGWALLYVVAACFAAVALSFCVLVRRGIGLRELSNLYIACSQIVGDAEYVVIDDIAAQVGLSSDAMHGKLVWMIDERMLTRAWFDEAGTTLMLTDHAYRQYQDAEQGRRLRESEEQRRLLERQEILMDAPELLKAQLTEGDLFLERLSEVRGELMPSDEMCGKLNRLEEITSRILKKAKVVAVSPDSLRKLTGYYLPTTQKLLDAYLELNAQPEAGENITGSKREILGVMDEISDAFNKLYDQMFLDTAWDISSDISVMKTMMERDGLK